MNLKLLFLIGIPFFSVAQNSELSTFIQSKISHEAPNPVHSILFYHENEETGDKFSEGFGLINKNSPPAAKDSRSGSQVQPSYLLQQLYFNW